MTPIVFNHIARLSAPDTTDEERVAIVQHIFDTKGIDGLFTLWSCQDYFDPTEPLDESCTPATTW